MDGDPVVDRQYLAELQSSVERNRRRAGALRFPLIAIAVANLALAGWCLIVGRHHLLVFYVPVLAVVILASRLHFRRLAQREGVLLPIQSWVLAACSLAVASAVVSRLGVVIGKRSLEEVGPSLVWVLGYHLLGRWGHNRALMAATFWMVPATLLLAAVTTGDKLVAGLLTVNGALVGIAALTTNENTP